MRADMDVPGYSEIAVSANLQFPDSPAWQPVETASGMRACSGRRTDVQGRRSLPAHRVLPSP